MIHTLYTTRPHEKLKKFTSPVCVILCAMEKIDFAGISTVGWTVIGFIAFLLFVFLILLIRRGIKFGFGDKTLSVGQKKEVNEKLESLKREIDQKEKDRRHDEELRKELFRQATKIDENEKNDEKRIIRRLNVRIKNIFSQSLKCEMPLLSLIENIKDVYQERIDDNNLRNKLSLTERRGYLEDILTNIQRTYERFLLYVPSVPCNQEHYPKWAEVKPAFEKLTADWADCIVEILNNRINEKITMYEEAREKFLLDESRKNACDLPMEKNKIYLRRLENKDRLLI